MKKEKCPLCQREKGRRLCRMKENLLICSRCCAATRGEICGDCPHYIEGQRYNIAKMKKADFKGFTARIDPEIDDAVDRALQCVERGDIAKGEALLAALMEENPDLYIVHFAMGTVLAMKKDYRGAIARFDKCLDIFPYFAAAWFNKGAAYQKQLDVGGTIKAFLKVVEYGDPAEDFVTTAREFLRDMEESSFKDSGLSLDLYLQTMDWFDDAFLKMRNREYEAAKSGFRKVLSLNRNHTQSYGNLGLCHAFLGERGEALLAFDKALEIDPEYEPAQLNKHALLSLKDGERMPQDQSVTVDYYKDFLKPKGL